MLKRIKHILQLFFTLSKSEQRGIIVLLILIFLVIASYFTLPFVFQNDSKDFSAFEKEIAVFREEQQKVHDSIRIIRLQNAGEMDRELARQKIKPFKFDPNKLPEEAWAALGLTKRQIKSIKKYEANGGKFRWKKDLKKMYAISDVEYEILEPYINIKSRFEPKEENVIGNRDGGAIFIHVEMNTADSALLVKRLKLAPWLAARVIKYRNLLGGFYQKQQLSEVYGFNSSEIAKRSRAIRVDATLIRQLNLNNSTFKQLVRHPYISYELTKYIVNTRKNKGKYTSIEELRESPLVSESLFYKIKPYLSVSD